MQVLAWWSIPWLLLKWLVQCVLADFCRFLGNMDMHMKKKILQGLEWNMHSNVKFKNHINHVPIDLWQNNNRDVVREVILFTRHFTIQISSFITIRELWDDSSLVWRDFSLILCCWPRCGIYIWNSSCLPIKCLLVNLWLRKLPIQGYVASLGRDTTQWELVYLCGQVYK